MALPQELAVDRPLKLGATFNGNTTDGFLTFRYDFQPDSMQRVQQGDLLFFGNEQDKIKFIPDLPEGDAPFHFDGPCTTLQQQDGEDIECVAIFNGTEWTLELVSARISAKHMRGTPQIPGYNVEVEDESAAGAQPAEHVAVAGTGPPEAAADDDIDPDLNDALDEALFAADNPAEESLMSQQRQQRSASPPPRLQQQPLHQAVQQLSVQPPAVQQPTQQLPQPAQPQHIQQGQAEEDPDDPWAEYGDAPAAPVAPQLTGAPGQPPAAVAPGSAALHHTGPGAVRVIGHEEGQDDDDDDADEEVHACTDDESDGLGVEVF